MSAKAPTVSVPGLVKELVDQFSNPLDFLRELIQNSIDAGSNRIDVTLEYRGDGGALIVVEDDGDGMDEKIIDDHLLVLFSSTKENDLTKIGKFGIGFVSVFAIQPDLVRVYTAKSGQSWRLDFPSYRRYEKYRLSEMREGTRVELHKQMPRREYDRVAGEALKTVKYWVRYSDTRIFFADKSGAEVMAVNEAFELTEGTSLRHQEEGTEVILGFSAAAQPAFGFYNRGLTLKEGGKAHFPGVSFKMKSRYLEHTLTRDNVMEDENYAKAMKIVERLVNEDLAKKLKADLAEISGRIARAAASGQAQDPRWAADWELRLPFLRALFSGKFSRWKRSAWPLFPSVSGRVLSLAEVREAVELSGGDLYCAPQAGPVSSALEKDGHAVLVSGPWVGELTGAWAWGSITARDACAVFIRPEVLAEKDLAAPARALMATLRSVDSSSGAKYAGIWAANFDYSDSAIKDRLFVTQKEPGTLSRADEKPVSGLFVLGRRRRHALLNAGHAFVDSLTRLHASQPGLAAFLALKVMHLHDGEVPPAEKGKASNLAEKVEERLLRAALRLDAPAAK